MIFAWILGAGFVGAFAISLADQHLRPSFAWEGFKEVEIALEWSAAGSAMDDLVLFYHLLNAVGGIGISALLLGFSAVSLGTSRAADRPLGYLNSCVRCSRAMLYTAAIVLTIAVIEIFVAYNVIALYVDGFDARLAQKYGIVLAGLVGSLVTIFLALVTMSTMLQLRSAIDSRLRSAILAAGAAPTATTMREVAREELPALHGSEFSRRLAAVLAPVLTAAVAAMFDHLLG